MTALQPLTTATDTAAAVAEVTSRLAHMMTTVIEPDPVGYLQQYEATAGDSDGRAFESIHELHDGEIVLGFYALSHLGDCLCTSTLPRKLAHRYTCRVRVVRHRSTMHVFRHNPDVAGFQNDKRVGLNGCLAGFGHVVQKLERFFRLQTDPYPRPEVHLSDEELAWAWKIRRSLPRNRPVVLICRGSITDEAHESFSTKPWQKWVHAIREIATPVQLALTSPSAYEEVAVLRSEQQRRWLPDAILDDCVVLENLDPRRFLAIFSVADFYLGTNAGGSHAAAAFDVPSFVILNAKTSADRLTFPNRHKSRHSLESFLYPQHWFGLASLSK